MTAPAPTRARRGGSRTKWLAVLLALAVVALAARYAWPHMQSLTGQAGDIRTQTAQLADRVQAAERVRADQSHYDALSAQAATAIPDAPRINDVIDRLQALCHSTGVQWISGVPQRGADVGGAHAWSVSMSLSGQAGGITSFLDALRGDPRLFVVDNVAITSADGVHLTASVVVRAFATGTDGTK